MRRRSLIDRLITAVVLAALISAAGLALVQCATAVRMATEAGR